MKDKPIMLVAFGGNALIQSGQRGTAEEQFKNLELTMPQIAKLSKEYKIVVTHGNGRSRISTTGFEDIGKVNRLV